MRRKYWSLHRFLLCPPGSSRVYNVRFFSVTRVVRSEVEPICRRRQRLWKQFKPARSFQENRLGALLAVALNEERGGRCAAPECASS